MTNEQEQRRKKFFTLIEPAMFNYPDQHYIDAALDGLEQLRSAEVASALDAVEEEVIGELAEVHLPAGDHQVAACHNNLKRKQRQSLQAVRKRYGVKP